MTYLEKDIEIDIPSSVFNLIDDLDFLILRSSSSDPKEKFVIVGGFVRDHLLGFEFNDIDMIHPHGSSIYESIQSKNYVPIFQPKNSYKKKDIIYNNPFDSSYLSFNIFSKKHESLSNEDFEKNPYLNSNSYMTPPHHFDFTINQFSYSPFLKKMFYTKQALSDLENRVLRETDYSSKKFLTTNRFLRSIRFSLKYGLTIHKDLQDKIDAFVNLDDDQINWKLIKSYLLDYNSHELTNKIYALLDIDDDAELSQQVIDQRRRIENEDFDDDETDYDD